MPRICCWLFVTFLWLCQLHMVHGDDSAINFNRDVKPILSDTCYRCHGPDEGERQTELRLDQQASAFSLLDSDTRAIVPRDVEVSEIIRRITSDDEDTRMPPPDSGKQVSPEQLDILKRWIETGAEWDDEHWSLVAPRRPALPKVVSHDWVENEIDRFVLAKLEENNWQPSARADKHTLVRRATLAVTGLPPSREVVRDFIADQSPDAYAKLVDRLLQSPRYGEHQTRYWLDLARYGDTHGLHLDNERSIWRYRDWVIDAFNSNMPFDQFTVEQLAGDLLPDATDDQRIATGFHRCNVTTSEGGAIAEEFLARYAVDRVETTSTVWMGLTTGCAACHDHKFDPISQREFYQLFAYFNNLTEKAMDGNAKLPPPSIKAPTDLQLRSQKQLMGELDSLAKQVEQWRAKSRSDRSWEASFAKTFDNAAPAPIDSTLHWTFESAESIKPAKSHGSFETIPGKQGNAFAFDGKSWIDHGKDFGKFDSSDAFSFGAWVQIQNNGANTVLSRMNDGDKNRGYDLYTSGGKVFVHLIAQWQDDAIRVNTKLPLRKEKWQHVFATYDGSSKAAGVTIYVNGVSQELEYTHDTLKGSIVTAEPFRVGKRKSSALFSGAIDELLVFDRCLEEQEVVALGDGNRFVGILATNVANRTESQDAELIDEYLQTHSEASTLLDAHTAAKKRLLMLEQSFPSTLVMEERKEPRDTFLLVRGEYDKKGEQVFPAVPAALPPSKAKEQSRLTLAKWLVSGEHPLTARVTVNRIWQQYFGVGIVKTSGDFGSQGEWPSHPMLLDYLATQLVDSGWDLKAIHRQILLSSTFQQSSNLSARAASDDPENRQLSHGPRFRMDAEMIRDFAMSTSGLMVGDLGGPSVKPPQPAGLWNAVGYTSSNTANFKADPPARRYRRGMYTFWKRTSPPPQMQILDAPSREVCTVRRPRTNTPAAALLLMNDAQFVEAARNLASRLLHDYNDNTARIGAAYEVCLARLPNQKESTVLVSLLESSLKSFRDDPSLAADLLSHGESSSNAQLDQTELAAWTMICSTILNLDETLNQH